MSKMKESKMLIKVRKAAEIKRRSLTVGELVKLATMLFITAFYTRTLNAENILVLAATSTTDVMKECAVEYEKESDNTIRFNFASSGALARQISSGASADIFISANVKWMDFLQKNKYISETNRRTLFGNRMVLIVPQKSIVKTQKNHSLDITALINGRIAVGNTKSVPCGMYAKEIFIKNNWHSSLKNRLVMAENARQVVILVERAEVDAGMVYATDAIKSNLTRTITTFPEESHTPILYPAALCEKSSHRNQGLKFLEFLSSMSAKRIFTKHGFTNPTLNTPIQ